jgi:hypothetical protein
MNKVDHDMMNHTNKFLFVTLAGVAAHMRGKLTN